MIHPRQPDSPAGCSKSFQRLQSINLPGIIFVCWLLFATSVVAAHAQTVTLDTADTGRRQTMDGFGSCLYGTEARQNWWQTLFYDDLQASILRVDLTPKFKSPWSGQNGTYNSPWFHNNPPLPGPDGNNVRIYTNATSYTNLYNGWSAPIAVMGPNINQNTNYFDFNHAGPRTAGLAARAGASRSNQLGGFKLIGSLWSPAPWVKISSGNTISGHSSPLPANDTPWPFVWYDNFSGGRLDTSGIARDEFNDAALGGSGPTSALTQFARGIAAYIRGFQQAYGVQFHAISIQNELNFEEFYNSCTYPLSAGYIAALKAVRAEFDLYPDLAPIQIMGPEDLLGGDAYGLWQYGGGGSTIHKNLQYLQNIFADPQASNALSFFCIHGYASDGVNAANATPTQWNWWANGWTASPAPGIPSNVRGYTFFNKKSWMTETSGENPAWLFPTSGYPSEGAWGLALRIHQPLAAGQQSAWIYWQTTDGSSVGAQTLTDANLRTNAAKYVAAKHYFRYIRPGAVRVDAAITGTSNLLATAFLHETNRTITLVLLNTSASSISADIRVPTSPFAITSFRAFTSHNGDLWRSSSVAVSNGVASVTVPGYGVATLYGMVPPRLHATRIANDLQLSWEQVWLGFQLQSTEQFSQAGWASVTNTTVITNGAASVLIPIENGARYFRLALP
jgi:O-glycosyl hydrolase